MAGPSGPKPTGTRPKSSSSSSQPSLAPRYTQQQQQQPGQVTREDSGQAEMGNLLWEQQAVSQNLALLRSHLDMLDRELPANSESQQPKNQRGRSSLVEERERRLGRREEERNHEIRVLRSRLRELESMVGVMEGRGREEAGLGETLEVERSLAMLTAQYEKAGADCDLEDELNCSLPSGLAVHVPPPMEQLNNASRVEESVRLARELRARKEQLERMVQKNTFPSNCNELPGEPRREGGRRKETNVAGGQFGVTSNGSQYGGGGTTGSQFGGTAGGGQFSASEQLIRLQHQVRSSYFIFTSQPLRFQGDKTIWRTRPTLWSTCAPPCAASLSRRTH